MIKKYLLLSYRDYLDSKYEGDIELGLTKEDKKLFFTEIEYLRNSSIEIIKVDYNYGDCIVVDNFDELPILELECNIYQCSRHGLICECCNPDCIDYNVCELSNLNLEIAGIKQLKQEYLDSLPENNILKKLFCRK
jgi:hypothetical protein